LLWLLGLRSSTHFQLLQQLWQQGSDGVLGLDATCCGLCLTQHLLQHT
jgi:hypothetical protein